MSYLQIIPDLYITFVYIHIEYMLDQEGFKNLIAFNRRFGHSPAFGHAPDIVYHTRRRIGDNLKCDRRRYRFIEDPDGSGEPIMVAKNDPRYKDIPTHIPKVK